MKLATISAIILLMFVVLFIASANCTERDQMGTNYILPEEQFKTLVKTISEYRSNNPGPGPNQSEKSGSTESWQELQRGKTLGKRTVVIWSGSNDAGGNTSSPVDMLTVEGPNNHAMQMTVTLSPPKFIKRSVSLATAGQAATGEQDNIELLGQSETTLPECTAIIDWGIGGVSQTAEVDFSNGAAINITASFVRLRGQVSNGRNPSSSQGAIVLGAFIGPGWPKPNNAQRTISLTTVGNDPSESTVLPIPRFSKQATLQMGTTLFPPVLGLPPIANSAYLRFWRSNQGIGAGFSPMGAILFNDSQRLPAIIPGGAYYFSVYYTTPPAIPPGNETNSRVVFDLNI